MYPLTNEDEYIAAERGFPLCIVSAEKGNAKLMEKTVWKLMLAYDVFNSTETVFNVISDINGDDSTEISSIISIIIRYSLSLIDISIELNE